MGSLISECLYRLKPRLLDPDSLFPLSVFGFPVLSIVLEPSYIQIYVSGLFVYE
jgi:hypothetical protein